MREICRKKGHLHPVHPPSIFLLPTPYQRQTVSSKLRNVEARNVDSESWQRSCELVPDSVLSWDELKEYCLHLETDVAQKDDRIILTEISGNPPMVSFSLTVFSDLQFLVTKDQLKFPVVT